MNLAALLLLATPAASRQPQHFDVASVKPTGSTDGRALLQASLGRLNMTNLTPRRLILIAWGIQD